MRLKLARLQLNLYKSDNEIDNVSRKIEDKTNANSVEQISGDAV